MAEPFVFHFVPDEAGRPEAMYIADLECACGLCQHPQLQRFYHATPFHPLTIGRITRLAASIHQKAGYECENCGCDVGPIDVVRGALRWAFADDAGELVGFVEGFGQPEGARARWQLIPERRLDPQVQPAFTPDEARPVHDRLDELVMEAALERSLSVKQAWRELALDWLEDPRGGAWTRVAPGYWLVIEADAASARALATELREDELGADSPQVALVALGPELEGPATHAEPSQMAGRWQGWMPEALRARLEAGRAWAGALVDTGRARQSVARAFEVARLEWIWVERGPAGGDFSEITTPRGGRFEPTLALEAIAERAVYTGVTPGEAGRLTAEEIVGTLLQIWGP